MAAAPRSEILLQGAYQGLVPSILGISCLAIAIRHIGPRATSVFISSVPVVAALAAIPILNELPGRPAWIGMTIVTAGILLALGIIGPPNKLRLPKDHNSISGVGPITRASEDRGRRNGRRKTEDRTTEDGKQRTVVGSR